jgi:triphosphatase
VSAVRTQDRGLDHLEVEWQFDTDDLDAVEDWLGEDRSDFGLLFSPVATKELKDTYYDTEDWRFYRAGYALRVRREGKSVEATMKALVPAEDGVRRRREISEPLKSGGMKSLRRARGPVGERLRGLAGARDLRPLFENRTRRRVFELRPEGDADDSCGEVALDESEISAKGESSARFSRVEVEVGPGDGGDRVEGLVKSLRGSLGLRPTETSKFGTGLAVAGLTPAGAPDLGPTGVDASMTAGEVAFAVLRRHFSIMLDHEPGVRLGEDPEDLHDMRVATRRLRATLKLYASFLPKRAERFERDLKWLAGSLGDVRDLDVHLEHLAQEAPGWDEEVLERVSAALEERRDEARRRMMETLDAARYERLVSGLSGMVRRGRSPDEPPPILEAAPELVGRQYKKVRKAAKRLEAGSPPEDFHDLRKKGKRLRYAVEPLQEIYGKPAKKLVDLLKEMQDDLGGLQDLIVFAGLMREVAVSGDLPPQTVFTMGSVAGRYARDASQRRENLPDTRPLGDLSKRWKRLRKEMEDRTEQKAGD